jgi:hypothetical protein
MVDGPAETKTAPVVLIAFNRPEVTHRTLGRIREAAPDQLLLIADGPRPGNDSDVANCAAVRRELEAIDWPCEVKRRYADVNLGLEPNIESGLDWVFDQVDEAIVVEDDCLPNADFFRFCSELLEHYRTADDVWMIAGRAPPLPAEVFDGASYAFTAVGPIWGWATWSRAWKSHRDGTARGARTDLAGSKLRTSAARRYFEDVASDRDGAGFSWDSRWSLSQIRERGLAVIPSANLIKQIGFGADATNSATPIPQLDLESIQWPLSHPAEREVNPEIEQLLERVLSAHHGRLARVVSRGLGDGRLKRVVRSAVGALRNRQLKER